MPRYPRRAKLNRIIGALLVGVFLTRFASAQFRVDQLDGVRQRLGTLRICLPADGAVEQLAHGLLSGYTSGSDPAPYGGNYGRSNYGRGSYTALPPLPPPADYLASLDRDIKACFFLSKVKEPERRKDLLAEIHRDVLIKAQDCQKFGMGRIITVHVSTLKGPVADSGWEVYYKWQTVSDFKPAEIRAPTLTSPATLQLPPGNYAIRAQKRVADQVLTTPSVTVVVGLQQGTDVQLPVQ